MKAMRIMLLAFFLPFSLFSQDVLKQKENALHWATEEYGNVTIDNGVTFVDFNGDPAVFCFTVQFGDKPIESPETILDKILHGREKRISGEALLREGQEKNSLELMHEGLALIDSGYAIMRGESQFASLFMSADPKRIAPLKYYKGLPPHYVSYFDALDIAGKALGQKTEIRQLIWANVFEMYAAFESAGKGLLVDLLSLEVVANESHAKATVNSENHLELFSSFNSEGSGLKKPLVYCELIENTTVKISGVPDYQTIHSRGCAPAASGCVLGYWDDHGYTRLVDGGGSSYAGSECVDGYLCLIWCDLADGMGYVQGTGTNPTLIDEGISKVANDQNGYSFSAIDTYYSEPADDRSAYKAEINSNYPLVYTLRHELYGGGGGLHTVAGIGYKEKIL